MRRFLPAGAVLLALLAATATTWAVTSLPPAGSQIGTTVQLGAPKSAVQSPACPTGVAPAKCLIVLTRATAVENTVDGVANPVKVTKAGELVSFTVGLAQLSSNPTTAATYVKNLNTAYGGVSQAQLTILKPGSNHQFTVVAEGPVEKLQPYLGYVVQFPLTTPIPVTPGEWIGLTVNTWAAILSYNLSTSQFQYRQSRRFNCSKPGLQQNAQLTVGQNAQYLCFYPGTRPEYGALELTNPVLPGTTTKTTTPKK
jgi:hypothetical protein